MDILFQIHNTNPHFPLSLLIIFVENFLLLQNHFLKDNNLRKIFKKIVDKNIFIRMFLYGNTNQKS